MSISPQISSGIFRRVQSQKPAVPLRLKVGQFVAGTVQKVLGNNRILTQIQGQSLVASSQISVNVGETLLMQVSAVRPKPKLRVIDQLKKIDTRGKKSANRLFQHFSDLDIPVSPSLFDFLFGAEAERAEVEKVLKAFQRAPKFWRRVLWHTTFNSFSQMQQLIESVNADGHFFSTEFIQQYFSAFPAKFRLSSFGDLVSFLQNFTGQSGYAGFNYTGSGTIWKVLQSLYWNSGYWMGDMFPLHFGQEKGVAAFSFWTPEESGEFELPVRLTILGAFINDWQLHAVAEFRQHDLAGVIDVNNSDFGNRLNEHIPKARKKLHDHGFSNVHIRVHYIEGMNLKPELLLPPVQSNNSYTG